MRLLITNDDGIDSTLLHALVGTLRAAGHDPNFSSSCHQAIRSGSLIGSRGLRSSANRFEQQITERAERARCDVCMVNIRVGYAGYNK